MTIKKSTIESMLDRTERELLEEREDLYLSRIAEKREMLSEENA